MDQPSNGELGVMIEGIGSRIDASSAQNSIDHARIEMQVLKTNGRVTSLERYKNMVVGALAVIAVVLGWVVQFAIKKS